MPFTDALSGNTVSASMRVYWSPNMLRFGINRTEVRQPDSVRMMTNRAENSISRRLACCRCGTQFTCNLAGPCWCAEETARLPMPVDKGEDCLCRDCLRKAAEVSESPQL
jgi:hypothetical protein